MCKQNISLVVVGKFLSSCGTFSLTLFCERVGKVKLELITHHKSACKSNFGGELDFILKSVWEKVQYSKFMHRQERKTGV